MDLTALCNLQPMALFSPLHSLTVLPPACDEYFCVMFSSLPFDSLILWLIVSAGQLTKMAALPSGSL